MKIALSFFLFAWSAWASIQYPGGVLVNATFTQVAGTRQELISSIEDNLNTAGWTTISGHHSTPIILQSGSTANSNQIQVDLIDPGSGNCAQVKLRNVAGSKVSQAFYLLPAAAKTWRVVAHQFAFVVETAFPSAAREFLFAGTLYEPAFMAATVTGDLGLIQGNAQADADATLRASIRTELGGDMGRAGQASFIVNGSLVEYTNVGTQNTGTLSVVTTLSGNYTTTGGGVLIYRWRDQTRMVSDPLVSWGTTLYTDEGMIQGQLYGMAVLSGSWTGDAALAFDSHNWIVITGNNVGSTAKGASGTVVMVTP